MTSIVAAGLLDIAWHPKDAYDLDAIVNIECRSCEGIGRENRIGDAFIQQTPVDPSAASA